MMKANSYFCFKHTHISICKPHWKKLIIGSLVWSLCPSIMGKPEEPVWRREASVAGWVNSPAQHPHENLCQDESPLSPEALKEMELNNLDRGILYVKDTLKDGKSSSLFSDPLLLCSESPVHCYPCQLTKSSIHSPWGPNVENYAPSVPTASGSPLWIFSLKLAFCIQCRAAGNADWH